MNNERISLKKLKSLPIGTVLEGYYSSDGESDMTTGDLIDYIPAGSVELVVINYANRLVLVDSNDMLRKYSLNDAWDIFDNGIFIK